MVDMKNVLNKSYMIWRGT